MSSRLVDRDRSAQRWLVSGGLSGLDMPELALLAEAVRGEQARRAGIAPESHEEDVARAILALGEAIAPKFARLGDLSLATIRLSGGNAESSARFVRALVQLGAARICFVYQADYSYEGEPARTIEKAELLAGKVLLEAAWQRDATPGELEALGDSRSVTHHPPQDAAETAEETTTDAV